jgi:copper(I)-binding protein
MRFSPDAPAVARAPRILGLALPAALLATVLAACGAGGGQSIAVSDAWVRAPTGAGALTAAYFTISNSGGTADALLSVSSPAATMAMIHQTTTDSSGMSSMHPVSRVEIPAGGTVRFEPGGYHVMLEGLPADTAVGATIELDLTFEGAGKVTVTATVRSG